METSFGSCGLWMQANKVLIKKILLLSFILDQGQESWFYTGSLLRSIHLLRFAEFFGKKIN